MSEIYGVDGKIINEKIVEVDGFELDVMALQGNPFLMMMCLICLDPTPKQAELLRKAEVVFTDSKNKQMFPPLEEEEEEK